MKAILTAMMLVSGLATAAQATVQNNDMNKVWGINQSSEGIKVAIVAPGLSSQEILSQASILATDAKAIKQITIVLPDHKVEDVVFQLQQQFPGVLFLIQYRNFDRP